MSVFSSGSVPTASCCGPLPLRVHTCVFTNLEPRPCVTFYISLAHRGDSISDLWQLLSPSPSAGRSISPRA